MADIVNEDILKEIASFIDSHNGQDTVILDISGINSWTDYFIITTVSSCGHLKGLLEQLYQLIEEKGLELLWKHKKGIDEKWVLLDCGDFIIHLMNQEAREFYNLEKLWFSGKRISYK